MVAARGWLGVLGWFVRCSSDITLTGLKGQLEFLQYVGESSDTGCMSIESLASGLSESKLKTAVGYSVARKTLDAAQAQGDAFVALIESAGKIGKSGGGDALATAATGKGGQVDIYA